MASGCLTLLVAILFVGGTLAKNVPKENNGWKFQSSTGMTREEFLETKGMGHGRYHQHHVLMRKLKRLHADKRHNNLTQEQLEGDLVDDVMLTNEQLEFEISRMQRRQKRKVINIDDPTNPYKSWNVSAGIPVPYMFDTAVTEASKVSLRAALAVWMAKTCVVFQEHTVAPTSHFIMFTATDTGCWSYIGSNSDNPQPVNLPSYCLVTTGTPLHEIGHVLGFFHEQSRWDRDDHVTVNNEYVQAGTEHNFAKAATNELSTLGVPYDMSSVMHYIAKAFAINPATQETISPNNPLYLYNLGQYIGLSYFDIKIFNQAFCGGKCTQTNNCLHDGYLDPNDCTKCKCPDGFGGDQCQETASNGAACNAPTDGIIQVLSTTPQCLEVRNYPAYTSCNFHLKGSPNTRTQVWFESTFVVLCHESYKICYHWVDVIFDAALNKRGARFCCYNTPTLPNSCDVISEGTDIVVTLRSDYNWGLLPGFKLCYKQVNSGDPCFTQNS